jgi:transposase
VFRNNAFIIGEQEKKGLNLLILKDYKIISLEVKQMRSVHKEKELKLEILKKAVHIFSIRNGRFMNL